MEFNRDTWQYEDPKKNVENEVIKVNERASSSELNFMEFINNREKYTEQMFLKYFTDLVPHPTTLEALTIESSLQGVRGDKEYSEYFSAVEESLRIIRYENMMGDYFRINQFSGERVLGFLASREDFDDVCVAMAARSCAYVVNFDMLVTLTDGIFEAVAEGACKTFEIIAHSNAISRLTRMIHKKDDCMKYELASMKQIKSRLKSHMVYAAKFCMENDYPVSEAIITGKRGILVRDFDQINRELLKLVNMGEVEAAKYLYQEVNHILDVPLKENAKDRWEKRLKEKLNSNEDFDIREFLGGYK